MPDKQFYLRSPLPTNVKLLQQPRARTAFNKSVGQAVPPEYFSDSNPPPRTLKLVQQRPLTGNKVPYLHAWQTIDNAAQCRCSCGKMQRTMAGQRIGKFFGDIAALPPILHAMRSACTSLAFKATFIGRLARLEASNKGIKANQQHSEAEYHRSRENPNKIRNSQN